MAKVMQAITMAVPRSGCFRMRIADTASRKRSGLHDGAPVIRSFGAPGEQVGGEDDEGELHQLGGLHLDGPGADPAARPAGEVAHVRDEDHGEQAEHRHGQDEVEIAGS